MARRTVSRRYKSRAPLLTYRQTDYQRPDREMGRPQLDTDTGEDEVNREKGGIPPLGDLAVVRHQFGVDIRLLPQRTSKVYSDRLPEVQYRVYDGGCNGGEGKSICDRKRSTRSRGH